MSHTHTTSAAPAPALSPATVALSATAKSIVSLVHSSPASPELLFYLNARDTTTLKTVSPSVSAFVKGRKGAIERYLAEDEANEIRVSEKTRNFWVEKKNATEELLAVLDEADKSESELSETGKKAREEYFEKTKAAWEADLALVLTKLSKELIGPFTLGLPRHSGYGLTLIILRRGTDLHSRRAPRRMVARVGDTLRGRCPRRRKRSDFQVGRTCWRGLCACKRCYASSGGATAQFGSEDV